MDGITHIKCHRSGDIVLMIDLIYSPDDGGYYLEKVVMPDDKPIRTYHSIVYHDKGVLMAVYNLGKTSWFEV